ncbi:MAG TPA: aldo/keto reductase [Prolixibacteraceae bacterium]|jgi:predicted aldo/keto reductase-like oxidoreductase|nr:aldo/keto reductase [Prolixibacteraceae bacterium]
MKKFDRRRFIQTSAAGLAGFTLAGATLPVSATELPFFGNDVLMAAAVDRVVLGKTGLTIPRVALGTGSIGGNQQSNQTRLGRENFLKLARHAWDRGIRFFDMADSYGSHTFVRDILKEVPREKTTLMSKMWTGDTNWQKSGDVAKTLDRFRQETGSDYFDILLMHCMVRPNWREEKKIFIEGLSEAKEKGIIKAAGVSCHNWQAMIEAAGDPWVDVILARINPFGVHMDNTPEEVSALLKKAKDNGKGIIGMKIFGNGDKISDTDREQSIRYAVTKGNIHAMTLGMESVAQVDDAVERVMRIVNQNK